MATTARRRRTRLPLTARRPGQEGCLKLQLRDSRNAAANAAKNETDAQLRRDHPLLSMLQTIPGEALSIVGYAHVRDTAAINKLIYSPSWPSRCCPAT